MYSINATYVTSCSTTKVHRLPTQINANKVKAEVNSKHRKMRAEQQHVCKEMNQYIINTNRKWIRSFGIEWTIFFLGSIVL
jgi:predicted nucleic acid-binding Zn ribbon protein